MAFRTAVWVVFGAVLVPALVDCGSSQVECKTSQHDCQGSIARNCVESYGEYSGNVSSHFDTQDCGSADLCIVTEYDAFCAVRPGKDSRCTETQYCDGTDQVTCSEGYAISIQKCRSCDANLVPTGFEECLGTLTQSTDYEDSNTCTGNADCAAGLTCIAGTCSLACSCPSDGQPCSDCDALPNFDSDFRGGTFTCQSGRCTSPGS